MKVEFLKANQSDFEEIINFANYVFSYSISSEDFPMLLPKLYKNKYNTSQYHYLVKENDKIKALIGCFPMEMDILGEKLKVCGIGTVSVHPYCRGKGYMKKLMNIILKDIKKNNVDLSCLSGLRQRYEYFSYEPCGEQIMFEVTSLNIRHKFGKCIHFPIKFKLVEDTDKNIIENMYNIHNKKTCKVVRDKDKFLDITRSWNCNVYAAFYDNEFIGYISCSKNGELINEIALIDDNYLEKLIPSYINLNKIDTVNILLPIYDIKKISVLQNFCESYSITTNNNFNILNYEKVIRLFLKLKSTYTRLLDGDLIINIENYGTIHISVKNSKIDVYKTNESADLCLGHLDAMQFLFSPLKSYFNFSQDLNPCVSSWLPLPLFFDEQDCV